MAERGEQAVEAELEVERAAGRRAALRTISRWAVPLQVSAIAVTGGGALFLAFTGRWQVWDWLFVALFALYVVNAIGFRLLVKRKLP